MNFGSLEALLQKMNTEGAALQGSGWVVGFVASDVLIFVSFVYFTTGYISTWLLRFLH